MILACAETHHGTSAESVETSRANGNARAEEEYFLYGDNVETYYFIADALTKHANLIRDREMDAR